MTANVGIEFRPAEDLDEVAVQQLWRDCGLSTATADEWDALMTVPSNVVLVAQDGGSLVGTAVASFDGWRAYIYHVAVSADARGRGIGHDLMQSAERYLTGAGARRVYVMVDEQNTEGMALVGSTGYVPEGDVVFVKRLADRFAT